MTALRQKMLEDMQLRGLSTRTQNSYLAAVRQLACHFNRAPDQLSDDDIRAYFLFLRNDKHAAPNTSNLALNALKFLFVHTLQRPFPLGDLIRPPIPKKLPVVLSPEEIWRIIEQVRHPHYRVCLSVIAACGLRLLEGVRLQVPQIDSHRMQLHIRAAKGNKDRAVPLPPRTLALLRSHWLTHRNPTWLFPSRSSLEVQGSLAIKPMEQSSLQKAFHRAVQEIGLTKPASIHSLRHSWATHLLDSGVNVRVLQLWMGHSSPTTTAIYTHLTQHTEQKAATALERLTAGLP